MAKRHELLVKYESRCQSCGGVFEGQYLQMHGMTPFIEGEPMVEMTLLCASCHRRFHTDELNPHASTSTP